ncbi:hypothetical protein J6590_002964 [Homalodisca vitripennis]|nr:hypothetical protein J6590_002964 [Homalodisca vitripennis]
MPNQEIDFSDLSKAEVGQPRSLPKCDRIFTPQSETLTTEGLIISSPISEPTLAAIAGDYYTCGPCDGSSVGRSGQTGRSLFDIELDLFYCLIGGNRRMGSEQGMGVRTFIYSLKSFGPPRKSYAHVQTRQTSLCDGPVTKHMEMSAAPHHVGPHRPETMECCLRSGEEVAQDEYGLRNLAGKEIRTSRNISGFQDKNLIFKVTKPKLSHSHLERLQKCIPASVGKCLGNLSVIIADCPRVTQDYHHITQGGRIIPASVGKCLGNLSVSIADCPRVTQDYHRITQGGRIVCAEYPCVVAPGANAPKIYRRLSA